MKHTIITVIIFALSFIGIAVGLYFFTDIDEKILIAILISYSLLFIIGLILFITVYCARLGVLFRQEKYEQVIKKSEWLLKSFVKGNAPASDTVRLMAASAYFALHDDESFLAYINQVNSQSSLFMKSYLLCIYHFVKEDRDAFNNEHTNVFLPLAACGKEKVTQPYKENLQVMSIYLNKGGNGETKEKLKELKLARVKEFIESDSQA